MLGLPFRLLRHTETGPVEKVIYLATRRHGDAGDAFRKAKREYYRAEFACARAAKRFEAAERSVQDAAPIAADYEALVSRRDELLQEISTAGEAANEAAEKLVRLSLKENYGPETDGILDQLTDTDLRAMVTLIDTGSLPKDFFGSGALPPSPTTTAPAGA